jgi:hypothetical protein
VLTDRASAALEQLVELGTEKVLKGVRGGALVALAQGRRSAGGAKPGCRGRGAGAVGRVSGGADHDRLEALAGGPVKRWHASDYTVARLAAAGVRVLTPDTRRRRP